MEKYNYDFGPIKQNILLEAHRLVDTYHIDTGHRCIRDLCELEAYVHRLKTFPGNDHDFITMHPDHIDLDQERSIPFKEKYIDSHPLILEGWNRLPR